MEQQDIVMKQAQNNDISRGDSFITVIEGCPGSGKSRVIKNIVVETLKAQTRDDKAVLKLRSKKNMFRTRILVCAKSNACVDEITEKLIDAQDESHVKFEVLRLGDTNKMTEKAKKVSLAEKIKQTTFELNQLNHISKEQRNEIKEKIIERCQVVTSTINSSFNANNLYRAYDIVIIDEATQCSLADLSIPLYFKPYKLILIGDTKQLGINLKSRALVNTRFDLSLLERIIKCHPKKDRTPM